MKKLLLAATILASVSTPAFADGNNRGTDTETFTLRANNPPKCNLEAADYTLNIGANQISDNDGFARSTVSAEVASSMNSAGVNAWCTGTKNTLVMYRTPFIADGTTGAKGLDGFNTAVVYDVTMDIADAVRSDGFDPIEGTSDGSTSGPGVGNGLTVGRFGPTGAGTPVVFAVEQTSNAVSDGNEGPQARSDFSADNARLIAGRYESLLTIELTPGN
jgi:hypothetical protein